MVVLGPSGPWIALRDLDAALAPERVAPPRVTAFPDALRVVTFNVEHGDRPDALIDAFRSHPELGRADVVLLQEIESHPGARGSGAGRLAAALGMGYVYAPSRRTGAAGTHGLAILCRWPLQDAALMALPHAPLPVHRRRCIALAAQVETPAGRLRLMSVHLDTRLNLAQRVGQLGPALADPHPLQIIGGDMNTLPFHFAAGALPVFWVDQAGRLDDHMRGLGFATPARGAGATHRHVLPVRLDAVFTRGLAPGAARVARDVRISDHYPVWVDVAWS